MNTHMSKYCVRRSRSITSFGVDPLTLPENCDIESRRPSTIAFRWRATPTPDRYLLSAWASADFTSNIFS